MKGRMIASCYYCGHATVAICAQCGVGICRECAVTDSSKGVICYKCGNSNLKHEHKEYRKWLKEQGGSFSKGKDFIFPGVIGILIVAAVGVMAFFDSGFREIYADENIIVAAIALFFLAYMLFSIPFCMIILSDMFAPRYDTRQTRLDKWCFKLVFSIFVGWIVFTSYLIRYMWKKAKRKRGK